MAIPVTDAITSDFFGPLPASVSKRKHGPLGVALGNHVPLRPSWDCACKQPWPCDDARSRLLARTSSMPLIRRFLFVRLGEAAVDSARWPLPSAEWFEAITAQLMDWTERPVRP